jgi:hypothetical protein
MYIKELLPPLLCAAALCLYGGFLTWSYLNREPDPIKTHYSVCLENTYPKCVLANKTLPSLETFCKVSTEIKCKELEL